MRVLRFLPLLLVGIVSTVRPAAGQGQPFYSHDNHTEYRPARARDAPVRDRLFPDRTARRARLWS